VPVPAAAVLSFAGSVKLLVLAIQQGVKGRIGLDENIAAFPAVTPVRSPLGDIGFPPEAQTAAAALSGNHIDACFVDEFHIDACTCCGEPGWGDNRSALLQTGLELSLIFA